MLVVPNSAWADAKAVSSMSTKCFGMAVSIYGCPVDISRSSTHAGGLGTPPQAVPKGLVQTFNLLAGSGVELHHEIAEDPAPYPQGP
ncbi:MAG TPA: hypothetical protein VNF50_00555 [Acidimicrobiales bacterium]|nr:hypothetical protein [Acidimicrobiales bacterium]